MLTDRLPPALRTRLDRATTGDSPPELPAAVPTFAAAGVAAIVALLVATTTIGSGDYGQWLMVSRVFSGGATPDYRALADVTPLVPAVIAAVHGVIGDPILALHIVGFLIVLGLGAAFHAAGIGMDGRAMTGLLAVVLGLLLTDRYLELLAFGGLLQAVATAWLVVAIAAFAGALRSPSTERRWWIAGCIALLATCLTHVPTATIALPVCLAAAALAAVPAAGVPIRARLREVTPLVVGLTLVGGYWLIAIAPASLGYVANPASLAYRGPERVIGMLADYPPTLAIVALGLASIGWWVAGLITRRRLPARRDTRTILLAWLIVSWGAFVGSALAGASTDYPRFVPILLAPMVVASAFGLREAGTWMARRLPTAAGGERGLIAIGVAVVVVAPFSIANYQSEAQGYQLPDDQSLVAAATWADERLVPGVSILAPVREGKWIEGLTGRAALFTSDVRYSFRPVEWDRSLAADALLRGNLAVANGAFVVTLTDGAPTPDGGSQPRALIVAANHGGEYIDLLRLSPSSSVLLGVDGRTLASLPALAPAGFDHVDGTDMLQATTRWSGTRVDTSLRYVQTVTVERASAEFRLDLQAFTTLPVGRLQIELRSVPGTPITEVRESDGVAEVSFARTGRDEPRLRLETLGGTITRTSDGLLVASVGAGLSIRFTDLTAGGSSTSLRLLDPATLVHDYDVGGVLLRRDPTYDERRARLELLGFRAARAEGPYVVMVRDDAVRPAQP